METIEQSNGMEPVKRPVFLTVLCILTFIWSGLMCFSSLITPLISDIAMEAIQNSPAFDETEMKYNMVILQAGWNYHAPAFLLALGSLSGAILMWNLKKLGFHLYAASKLALLFLPLLVLNLPIGIPAVMMAVAFIIMYALNLKYMS